MTSQLKLVRGVVSNLEVHAGEDEFIRSESQRAAGGAAAIGLAAAGMAGPAVGASIAATGRDSVEFFTCIVDGKLVTGRFSKASFKDGDEVEVVLEAQADGRDLALAVRRPSDKTLWMLPHCSRGKIAHRVFSIVMAGWILTALLGFSGVFVGIMESIDNEPTDWGFIMFSLGISGALSLAVALYYSIRFLYQWAPLVERAEAIFSTLGYSNPARVNLEEDHKRACKARGEKWPYLSPGPWIYQYLERS